LSARDLSFDPTPEADDEDGGWSPAAYLPAADADPAVAVERAEWDAVTAGSLAEAIEALDPRSRRIIETRWLAEDKLTLHDLADEFGVSAERIRQIEANALKKLRGLMD
jgi:RNA polymerase sigma-32 factor